MNIQNNENNDKLLKEFSPKGVEFIELGEVCHIYNGSTPKRSKNEYWNNGSIPWFTINDIRKQGRIIFSTQQKITEKGLNKSGLRILPKNTTLLCCTASIGEQAYTEIELTTNQQFNGLVIKDGFSKKINPKYLYWCSTNLKDELKRISGKTTFTFVSINNLKKIKIPVPPIEEQKRIVSILDKFDILINDISTGLPAEINARRKQYEYYRDRLLTFEDQKQNEYTK